PMAKLALEELRQQADLGGTRVPGGTNKDEVAFLHALTLEQMSQLNDAIDEYLSIGDGRNEYYGWRATERLKAIRVKPMGDALLTQRIALLRSQAESAWQSHKYDDARKAAQSALRLTDDPVQTAPLTDLVVKACAQLAQYNDPPRLKG